MKIKSISYFLFSFNFFDKIGNICNCEVVILKCIFQNWHENGIPKLLEDRPSTDKDSFHVHCLPDCIRLKLIAHIEDDLSDLLARRAYDIAASTRIKVTLGVSMDFEKAVPVPVSLNIINYTHLSL